MSPSSPQRRAACGGGRRGRQPHPVQTGNIPYSYYYYTMLLPKEARCVCRQDAGEVCQTPTPCWTHQIQGRPTEGSLLSITPPRTSRGKIFTVSAHVRHKQGNFFVKTNTTQARKWVDPWMALSPDGPASQVVRGRQNAQRSAADCRSERRVWQRGPHCRQRNAASPPPHNPVAREQPA